MLSALKASSLHQSSKKGLYAYIAQKGILKAEQDGFRKMHGTVGSIFTLKMLVDKYVMRNHFRENIKLTKKLFDALIYLPYSFTRVKYSVGD